MPVATVNIPGKSADTAHNTLKPRIVMRKNVGLCAEVSYRVGQSGCLGSHILIFPGVLLTLKAHPRHRVEQLTELH